jgi:hypothetical protein
VTTQKYYCSVKRKQVLFSPCCTILIEEGGVTTYVYLPLSVHFQRISFFHFWIIFSQCAHFVSVYFCQLLPTVRTLHKLWKNTFFLPMYEPTNKTLATSSMRFCYAVTSNTTRHSTTPSRSVSLTDQSACWHITTLVIVETKIPYHIYQCLSYTLLFEIYTKSRIVQNKIISTERFLR